jgi:hypothetical protein
MDTLNRTSRWHRGATKKVRITPHDLGILNVLQRYRYASTEHIHAFVGVQKNRFQERLGRLYREPNCYIDRPAQQRQYFNANYRPIIYELDRNGERALREYGRWDDDAPIAWLNRGREGHTDFAHSVMICEALASIELGIRANSKLRFIPWAEIKARMPEKTRTSKLLHCLPVQISHSMKGQLHHSDRALMPDAVFGIEYEGKARLFALECDRDNEPLERSNLNQTSYLRKLLQYRQVIQDRTYSTHWILPNLLVLNLTTSDLHMRKIMALATELFEGGSSNFLLFKTMPSLGDFAPPEKPTGRLLTEPWLRPGRPAFRIDQPTEGR